MFSNSRHAASCTSCAHRRCSGFDTSLSFEHLKASVCTGPNEAEVMHATEMPLNGDRLEVTFQLDALQHAFPLKSNQLLFTWRRMPCKAYSSRFLKPCLRSKHIQTHPKPHISGGLRRQKRLVCGEFSGKLDCRTERFTPCEFSETVHLLDMAFTTSKADSRIPTVAWTA